MNPVPLMYFVQSETGQHMGYVMPLEIAKLIIHNKPPPDEREYVKERLSATDGTNTRPIEFVS